MPRFLVRCLAVVLFATGTLVVSARQTTPIMAVADIRPGMVGVGRTVFAGETIEDFKVNILGVLRNVMGPSRDLILAKLEGPQVAAAGVIQGMSGSPVYVDGKLIGAVSYSLGSFPKEPYAGITPIGEMTGAVDRPGPRTSGRDLALQWPASAADVYTTLRHVAERASAPVGSTRDGLEVFGPASLADMAGRLRPIGAAMVFGGFEPDVDRDIRRALAPAGGGEQAPAQTARGAATPPALRPGDAVGVSLIRGDLEMGASGTVTHIDGSRLYAFGHPFLNLGPTSFAMTRSHVFAVLPSLDASLKIASLGQVIGTMTQDRATAIGGILGAGPRELEMTMALSSDGGPDRHFTFYVLQDQLLTPLFSYVAVLNTLASYQRQTGPMSVTLSGSVSFGPDGKVAIEDVVSGDNALTLAAAAATGAIGAAMNNDFRSVTPEKFDLRVAVQERADATTIERVWLDTTKPHFGATHMLQVLLRNYRGATETVSMPITMPAQAAGPLTLLVSDAGTLAQLEQRELRPGKPTSLAELMQQLNASRRNNRLYVRLISPNGGTVVGGESLPALPSSVRSVLDADKSVATGSIARTVVGAWDRRFDRAVRGSRELTITLTSGQ